MSASGLQRIFESYVIPSEHSESRDLGTVVSFLGIDSAKIPRLHFISLGMTSISRIKNS